MATLSAVPDTVDLACLGGDTFTFSVTAPAALVSGKEWAAQIRLTYDAATVDATFEITPPTVADGPAYLSLSADETARLVAGSAFARIRAKDSPQVLKVQQYKGVWDVQVAGAGGSDPVVTLARGTITIEPDVTRLAALL